MNTKKAPSFSGRLALNSLTIVATAVLAACSGGGATCDASAATCCSSTSIGGGGSGSCDSGSGTGSTGTPNTAAPKVSASISSRTVSDAVPATVKGHVVDSAGRPLSGQLVTFSADATIGTLSPSTALTDDNGDATVTISPAPGAKTGAAGEVTVTTVVGGTSATSTVAYQLSAADASFGTFAVDPKVGGAADATVPAYGQTTLSLTMAGVTTTAPAAVTLTSSCVSQGKATISPATAQISSTAPVTFVYKDTGGCGSTIVNGDPVTATIVGSTKNTSVPVYLTTPVVNGITFVDAKPDSIYLKGSGYATSSTVTFLVVDKAGNPLPNQLVGLALSSYAGGVTLDSLPAAGSAPPADGTPLESKLSDANGKVTAIVNSGTVPTPVRVVASLGGQSYLSNVLTVNTGLPSQANFSLVQATANIEGFERDGNSGLATDPANNLYTVHAADRSGNPVPNGTAVNFIMAEPGSMIHASAVTSVDNATMTASASAYLVASGTRPLDGRVTVLAYAIGEESFVDLNGDNVWETNEPFGDLGDIFKDVQYDNHFDPTRDEFISLGGLTSAQQTTCATFSSVSQFTLGPNTPSRPGTCDGTWSPKTYVRRAVETVLSSSYPRALWNSVSTEVLNEGLPQTCTGNTVSLFNSPPYEVDATGTLGATAAYYNVMATSSHLTPGTSSTPGAKANTTWYTANQKQGAVSLLLADSNYYRLNPMPAGSTVTVSTPADGVTLKVEGGAPIPNSLEVSPVVVSYKFDTGAPSSVPVNLVITTPTKVSTIIPFTINTANRPAACPN